MKKRKLLNFFEFSEMKDYVLIEKENGFKMDFSRPNSAMTNNSSINERSVRKSGVTSLLLILLLFLFTNFLFAQQPPACNLQGPLKATYSQSGGQTITFSSETVNTVPGTNYYWTLKSNSSNAKFIGKNGKSTIKVAPGTRGGTFTVQLKVINPGPKSNIKFCLCTQSVTVIAPI
jgi:hypothetical protein